MTLQKHCKRRKLRGTSASFLRCLLVTSPVFVAFAPTRIRIFESHSTACIPRFRTCRLRRQRDFQSVQLVLYVLFWAVIMASPVKVGGVVYLSRSLTHLELVVGRKRQFPVGSICARCIQVVNQVNGVVINTLTTAGLTKILWISLYIVIAEERTVQRFLRQHFE